MDVYYYTFENEYYITHVYKTYKTMSDGFQRYNGDRYTYYFKVSRPNILADVKLFFKRPPEWQSRTIKVLADQMIIKKKQIQKKILPMIIKYLDEIIKIDRDCIRKIVHFCS